MASLNESAGLPEANLDDNDSGTSKAGFWTLALGSVGVVYGDIGTSPLYALREAMVTAASDGSLERIEILGVLSLILWALLLIVTLKYVIILLRADNNGEGGTLSLMALARSALGRGAGIIFALGVAGAALFYGDAIITPAISVLSAVEGLELVAPFFTPYVIPITVAIIIGLFAVQSGGTQRIAGFFGPITVLWFIVIAVAGLPHIFRHPEVLGAVNPYYAVYYLGHHGSGALVALGTVFLAVTGAEALYADLGHFGRKPIRLAWLGLVLPALMLNYFGQAALVLDNPATIENPFFLIVPGWALLPTVILATIATVIASQAVITGAYSLSQQAIQLGLLPRMEIRHTSAEQRGQIYMPSVNGMLMVGVLILVLAFESSNRLASAYGIAVTATMVVTALMAFIVIWKVWKWPVWAAAALMAPFLVIDLAFFASNLLKILEGGWVPLTLGFCLMGIMVSWTRGVRKLMIKTRRSEVPLADLVASLESRPPHQVQGTAIFLTGDPDFAPAALLHNLKHNRILHERNVIMTVSYVDQPRAKPSERFELLPVSDHFVRVALRFGYMETPNVPRALARNAAKMGWKFEIMNTSFFLSRRSLRSTAESGFGELRARLFITLARNAADATDFFQIPAGRVIEVGTQISF
jgi:KUP system potassium uptake protein